MLLNFTVSNWKSFKEKTSLSMIASKEKQHANHIQYLPEYKLNVLPIAVVFGANAAGKSNLVKAIDFAVGQMTPITRNRWIRSGLTLKMSRKTVSSSSRSRLMTGCTITILHLAMKALLLGKNLNELVANA